MNNETKESKSPANSAYIREFLNIRQEIKDGNATWQDVMDLREKYNMPLLSKDTVRRGVMALDEVINSGWDIIPPNDDNFVNTKETTFMDSEGNINSEKTLTLSFADTRDAKKLMEAHGYSPDDYILVSAKNSKWQQGNGKQGIRELYSSKIVVKPRYKNLTTDDFKEIEEHFKNYEVSHKVNRGEFEYKNFEENEQMLVIALYDVHFGRLSLIDETGESYDLEIAKKRMLENINKYINRFKNRKFSQIILPVGQDYFQASATGTTTSGRNRPDCCTNFKEMYKKGAEALIEVIELLARCAPVKVIFVPGNHATNEEYTLSLLVQAYYHNDFRVGVDATATTRKYIKFGESCVGFTHGSEEKDRIYGLMQGEVPSYFASTREHMFITGHFHKLGVSEQHGITVWSVPTLVSPDQWTVSQGYISKKRTMAFVFDKNEGLVETHFVNFK